MKKMLKLSALLMAVAFLASGCGFVTSSVPGLNVATGEAWYTKDKYFLIFPLGTDVYYCKQDAKTCYKAQYK
jgi:hypothetical protein